MRKNVGVDGTCQAVKMQLPPMHASFGAFMKLDLVRDMKEVVCRMPEARLDRVSTPISLYLTDRNFFSL